MGREEGGGFRMGNTCIPVADSFRYLAKPIQYCKVKKKTKTGTHVSWSERHCKVNSPKDEAVVLIYLNSALIYPNSTNIVFSTLKSVGVFFRQQQERGNKENHLVTCRFLS